MSYRPISGACLQYFKSTTESATDFFLKGFIAGSSTALSMATDSTGGTLLAKCAFNDDGNPISNPADPTTEFIPYFDQPYKLGLYPTEADADANTNPVWLIDNIENIFDAGDLDYTSSTTVEQKLNNLDVDDYNELRGLTSSQLVDGDAVHVTDDGIGGLFAVRTGTVTDNGGTLIVFSDDANRYAERVFSSPVNVKWFGAVGDGVANDSEAIDNAIALVSPGGIVFFPIGVYLVDGNISVTKSIIFKGEGLSGESVIKLDGTNTGDDIVVLAAGSDGTQFKDIQLLGNWDTTTTPTVWGHGIHQTAVSSNIVLNNVIVDKTTGSSVKIVGGIKHLLIDANLQNPGLDGLWLDGSSNPITNVSMLNGSMQVCRRSCARHEEEVSGVRYYGVTMFLAPIGVRFAGGSSAVHTQIIGGYLEDISSSGVPMPPFWVSANAPLDSEDGGSTAFGTGDAISLLGVDIKSDAAGLTNIVNTAVYQWTASGSGTNEYYCELLGGGDPSLSDPNDVRINGMFRPEQLVGNLNADEWGYGDNDTLGFNTVYVRLADGTDPDTKALGWVQHVRSWEIPTNQTTVNSIEIVGCGVFLSRPGDPRGASDPLVFYDRDQTKLVQNKALGAFPNGVERRLAENTADGVNAGIARALVETYNSSSIRQEAYIEINGDQQAWTVGSPNDIGVAVTGRLAGQLQLIGINEPTTVGAAGGASPLPATPLGYFEFQTNAGTVVKIPFYNP